MNTHILHKFATRFAQNIVNITFFYEIIGLLPTITLGSSKHKSSRHFFDSRCICDILWHSCWRWLLSAGRNGAADTDRWWRCWWRHRRCHGNCLPISSRMSWCRSWLREMLSQPLQPRTETSTGAQAPSQNFPQGGSIPPHYDSLI